MSNPNFNVLGIWNESLYRIGADRLKSLTDATNVAAQFLTDIYPFELADFLEEHPWSFAVTTIPMIPLNPPAWVTSTNYIVGMFVQQAGGIYLCVVQHTSGVFATDLANGDWVLQAGISPILQPLPIMNDGCNNPYFMPADFINPYLFSAPAFYRKEIVKPPYLPANTNVLLTNNPNILSMKYVFNQPDVTQFSGQACLALAIKLAYKLCFKISEAAQYAVALKAEYDGALMSAIAKDSNTTSPDQAIANEWFIARLSGSPGAIGLGQDNNNVGFYIPGVFQ